MPSRAAQITANSKQRIIYRTFTPNLSLLPSTGELQMLVNYKAVAQSIYNLIMTYPTERYYQPNVGSTVSRSLFEFTDQFTLDQIQDSILTTLTTYEPRAQNLSVVATAIPENNTVEVNIGFTMALLPGQTFQTQLIVLPVR